MKKALLLLICSFSLSLAFSLAYAQDTGGEDSPEEEKPTYLNPVSNAADLNLLAGIFGDIARAAAGQLDLADMVMDPDDGNGGPMNTDSVLSAMMYVYLTGVMAITGILIVIMSITMAIQAGIEGKVLSQRYNEWAVIRTLYAVFAILPVVGGWSVGQYALLNGTFYVNEIANEMNTIGNKWVFARNTTTALELDPFEYRPIIEAVYLGNLCVAVNNHEKLMKIKKHNEQVAKLQERLDSAILLPPVRAGLEAALSYMTRTLPTDGEGSLMQMNETDLESYERESSLKYTMSWGSVPSTSTFLGIPSVDGGDECGSVTVDYSSFWQEGDSLNATENRKNEAKKRTLENYFNAHTAALESVNAKAEKEFDDLLASINQIKEEFGAMQKLDRAEAIEGMLENPVAAAFSGAFDKLGKFTPSAIDALYSESIGEYTQAVREEYNNRSAAHEELFDDLLQEMAKRQREGGSGGYRDAYDAAGVELDSKYDAIADDRVRSLIENTSKGWLFAGFKWWDISRATSNQKELEAHVPTRTLFDTSIDDHRSNVRDDLERVFVAYSKAKMTGLTSKMVIDGQTRSAGIQSEAVISEEQLGSADESRDALYKGAATYFTQAGFNYFSNMDEQDMLAAIQEAGHKYLLVGEAILAAGFAIEMKGVVAKAGGGSWAANLATGGASGAVGEVIHHVTQMIAGLLYKVAWILILVGVVYAVYLPLLPAMIWTFSIVGWLEKLIGLIIMFPVWMAGHIFPDGDGIINGIGRQGYIMAASVLLRPPVMVFTIHFSMAALGAIGYVVYQMITTYIPDAQAGYFNGPVITIGTFVVVSGFMVVLVHMILAWNYKIPDSIPHFIGGPGDNYGEGEAKSHMGGISGLVVSHTQGFSGGGGGGNHQKSEGKGKGKKGARGFAQ